jgi:hypothetical protein
LNRAKIDVFLHEKGWKFHKIAYFFRFLRRFSILSCHFGASEPPNTATAAKAPSTATKASGENLTPGSGQRTTQNGGLRTPMNAGGKGDTALRKGRWRWRPNKRSRPTNLWHLGSYSLAADPLLDIASWT